ncbi:MAG: hypothetical protein WBB85_03005 [Albidovulum sp.]|jgi:hypothetical protein|uniref:hypothetical protein n=1 Tax=Albidovulum sp. TaxID=1872424 RepID=UPI003C8E567D
MRLALLLALMTLPAAAQGLRPSDSQLDATGLSEALTGQVIEFYDGSKSYYYPDGTYIYTYVDGGEEWDGTYELAGAGSVCVRMTVGGSRCDTYVMDGDRLVLVIADGTRFPVRARTALQ